MKKPLVWGGATGVAIIILGIGAYVFLTQGERPVHASADDAELVSLGREVYAQQCASCHGAALEGQADWKLPLPTGGRPAPPHDETGHTWHHPDQLLFDLTKRGGQAFSPTDYQNNMPAFAELLTDREILASLAFIKSTWPRQIQAQQERINRRTAAQ